MDRWTHTPPKTGKSKVPVGEEGQTRGHRVAVVKHIIHVNEGVKGKKLKCSSQEHWLPLQRTQVVWVSALIWRRTTIHNSSSSGLGALFWSPNTSILVVHIHTGNIHTYKTNLKIY